VWDRRQRLRGLAGELALFGAALGAMAFGLLLAALDLRVAAG
jgi:hypothetical protein